VCRCTLNTVRVLCRDLHRTLEAKKNSKEKAGSAKHKPGKKDSKDEPNAAHDGEVLWSYSFV
jgi:hypothetical protein